MRGYFGIGSEGIHKPYNVGALMRTAHAFGASFVYTVAASYDRPKGGRTDTSKAHGHVPFYSFPDVKSLLLPEDCKLVGVELLDDAIDLPSFHHPPNAAYILGPERGSLSPEMVARCDYTLKIPTRFCINVGLAGALVMYDRVLSTQRFAPRPLRPGGPTEALPENRFGGRFSRVEKFRDVPPEAAQG
ncbi:RNA methyltransferase [Magnetospira sp. QH-2]|uniref:RNA methyltransferase n=1 Tax=Magnetospira sp. (strain QH-2) TaxID=1288970 RepID=UPI0003E81416|nr:RNA methyltransferase [Magnetospira sp. QH-2]CCQ72178.1 tRNA/rRNA methyltransferase (SpoU) [Magnetospira sp. QH-2]